MNKNIVPIKGTHDKYSFSPIWVLAISRTNSVTNSINVCFPLGISFNSEVVRVPNKKIIAITIQELIRTCP